MSNNLEEIHRLRKKLAALESKAIETMVRSNNQTLFTEKEVAEIWNLNVRTLQQFRSTGRGPEFIKVGRSVRYSADGINSWLQKRSFKSTKQFNEPKD